MKLHRDVRLLAGRGGTCRPRTQQMRIACRPRAICLCGGTDQLEAPAAGGWLATVVFHYNVQVIRWATDTPTTAGNDIVSKVSVVLYKFIFQPGNTVYRR
jgi:hypothetical protein